MNRLVNFIQILIQNIRRNILKELVIGLGITLATLVLIIGSALGNTIEKMYKTSIFSEIPVDEIRISGQVEISGLGFKSIEIGPIKLKSQKKIYNIHNNFIDQIRKWDEIKSVIPVSKANFPITAIINLKPPLGQQSFFFEPPVIGIPKSLAFIQIKDNSQNYNPLKKDFPNGFIKHNNVVPVLIPVFIHEIARHFMKVNQLPEIDVLKFFDLTLMMNHSRIQTNFLNESKKIPIKPIKAKIIGYSDFLQNSVIAIPQNELELVKKQIYGKNKDLGYEGLIIKIKNPNQIKKVVNKLKPLLHNLNLKIDNKSIYSKISGYIDRGIQSFQHFINLFSTIILFISAITIFYAFLYLFYKREKEMHLYRIFGATRLELIIILVFESALVGFICSSIGYLISYFIITSYLPQHIETMSNLIPKSLKNTIFTFDKNKLFLFDHVKNLQYIIIAVITCIISAFIPAMIGTLKNKLTNN